jgi:hypothetical protein
VFDFINTEQVFEHIAAPLDTLTMLAAALRREGLIKISVPDARDLKRRLNVMDWTAPYGSRNSLNDTIPLIHVNSFTHRSLVRMAQLAGLEPVNIPLRLQYIYATNWRLYFRPARCPGGADARVQPACLSSPTR